MKRKEGALDMRAWMERRWRGGDGVGDDGGGGAKMAGEVREVPGVGGDRYEMMVGQDEEARHGECLGLGRQRGDGGDDVGT